MGTVPGEMVQLCLPAPGFKGLDTALMYSGGKSETLLGEMACWKGATEMATKVETGDKTELNNSIFCPDQPLGGEELWKGEREETGRGLSFQAPGILLHIFRFSMDLDSFAA